MVLPFVERFVFEGGTEGGAACGRRRRLRSPATGHWPRPFFALRRGVAGRVGWRHAKRPCLRARSVPEGAGDRGSRDRDWRAAGRSPSSRTRSSTPRAAASRPTAAGSVRSRSSTSRGATGTVRHVLARPVEPGPVTVRLDWARRFDHMQQHTGQHLLTAVAADRFGWPTTAFHLGERICDVELDVAGRPRPRLSRRSRRPSPRRSGPRCRSRRDVSPRTSSPPSPCAPAACPTGHEGDVRLVEIAGVDLNTCGGTHVRSTAEIEAVKLLGTRADARRHAPLLRRRRPGAPRASARTRRATPRLRALLGAPDEELAAVAEAKLEQLQAAEKRHARPRGGACRRPSRRRWRRARTVS